MDLVKRPKGKRERTRMWVSLSGPRWVGSICEWVVVWDFGGMWIATAGMEASGVDLENPGASSSMIWIAKFGRSFEVLWRVYFGVRGDPSSVCWRG